MDDPKLREIIGELKNFRFEIAPVSFSEVKRAYAKAIFLSIVFMFSNNIVKIKFSVLSFFIIRFIAYFTKMNTVLFGTGLTRIFIYLLIFCIIYIFTTIFIDGVNKMFLKIGMLFYSIAKYDLKFIFVFIRITQVAFLIRYYAPFTSYVFSFAAIALAASIDYKQYVEIPITILMIFVLFIHFYELVMSPFNPAKSIEMNYTIYQKYYEIRNIESGDIPIKLMKRERFSPGGVVINVFTLWFAKRRFSIKITMIDKYLSTTWDDYKEYLQISNIYHRNIFEYMDSKISILIKKLCT